ncbi:hypothetical protein CRM22_005544 [Opisthorchis felineus]|uniref:Uncharacterized protein n=1 Tax=Opisthorchis felineus TaxID=147828 RepID=A0A4S2LQK6_OPIFE|nr:hypothetical protein CRM22_005544 [Opisthorchis felineus]
MLKKLNDQRGISADDLGSAEREAGPFYLCLAADESERFSFSACFPSAAKPRASQVPPSLPAPPSPLPELVSSQKASGKVMGNHINGSHAMKDAGSGDHYSEAPIQSIVNNNHSETVKLCNPPPPTIAESVTYSDFDNLCQINECDIPVNHTLNHHQGPRSRSNHLCTSEESILSALVRKQLPGLGDEILPDADFVLWSTKDNKMLTVTDGKPDNRLFRDSTHPSRQSSTMEAEQRSTRQIVQDRTDYKRISLPEQEYDLKTSCQNDQHKDKGGTIRKRWSVCDRPRLGQVATVASAWEEYFNPALRSSRVLSYQGNASQSTIRSSHTECNFTTVTATLKADKNNSENKSQPYEGRCEHTSTETNVHSARIKGDILPPNGSATFSSISSLEDYPLARNDDYIHTYPQVDFSTQALCYKLANTALLKCTPENEANMFTVESNSTGSESAAQISDLSSSTLTISEAQTPIEEFPGTISPIELDAVLPKVHPVTNAKTATMTQPVPRELYEQPTHFPFRPRSTSTPAATRRPLKITLGRHRIFATRSPTALSNSSGESTGWTSDQGQCTRPRYYRPVRSRTIQSSDSKERVFVSPPPCFRDAVRMDQSLEAMPKLGEDSTRYTPTPNESALPTTPVLRRRVTVSSFATEPPGHGESEEHTKPKTDLTRYTAADRGLAGYDSNVIKAPRVYTEVNNGYNRKSGRSVSARNPPLTSDPSEITFQRKLGTCKMDSAPPTTSDSMVTQTYRTNRSRGIYKNRSNPTMQNKNQQTVTSSERPIIKTVALSPAAQRYEEHVQASMSQRPYAGEVTPVWFSKLTRGPFLSGDGQGNQTSNFSPSNEFHSQLMNPPEMAEGDTMDPDLWRQKLGLIARWQHEVNSAMQAGETELHGTPTPSEMHGSPNELIIDSTPQDATVPLHSVHSINPSQTDLSYRMPYVEPRLTTGFQPVQTYFINPPGVCYATAYNSFSQPNYDNAQMFNPPVGLQQNLGNQPFSVTPTTVHMAYMGRTGSPNNYIAGVEIGHPHYNPTLIPPNGQQSNETEPISRFSAVVLPATYCSNTTNMPSDPRQTRSQMAREPRSETTRRQCHNIPAQKPLQCYNHTYRSSPPLPYTNVAPRSNRQHWDNPAGAQQPLAVLSNGVSSPQTFKPSRDSALTFYSRLSNGDNGNITFVVPSTPAPASGHPVSLMCQSTPPDALATQLADTNEHVTNRESECIPIYEGMENWGNWDGTPNVEWTRIPPPANRRATMSIQPTVTSISKCEQSTNEGGIPKPTERGRRRSVTRLQLTVPKTSQDPMTSSQLTQASSISTNIELRPTLRRAATISPVRRRAEVKDGDAVPNGQLANSSGFASAGSITGVQEDTGPVISRPLAPFRASERGQKRGANGLPPAVDVHAGEAVQSKSVHSPIVMTPLLEPFTLIDPQLFYHLLIVTHALALNMTYLSHGPTAEGSQHLWCTPCVASAIGRSYVAIVQIPKERWPKLI